MPRQLKIRVIVLKLQLEFPEEVDVDAASLTGKVLEAVMDYDIDNKLLPGVPLRKKGDRLSGIMCSFESEEWKQDLFPDFDDDWEPSPLQKVGQAKQFEIMDVSGEIDMRVQTLTEAQAKLWNAFDKISRAEDMADVAKGKRAGTWAIKKARKVLEAQRPG